MLPRGVFTRKLADFDFDNAYCVHVDNTSGSGHFCCGLQNNDPAGRTFTVYQINIINFSASGNTKHVWFDQVAGNVVASAQSLTIGRQAGPGAGMTKNIASVPATGFINAGTGLGSVDIYLPGGMFKIPPGWIAWVAPDNTGDVLCTSWRFVVEPK